MQIGAYARAWSDPRLNVRLRIAGERILDISLRQMTLHWKLTIEFCGYGASANGRS
jgi:hypothetical protein